MPRHNRITVDSVRSVLDGSFPGNLGIEPLEVEDDHTTGRIVVDSRHLHPGGFVHGGVWTALGDTVAACKSLASTDSASVADRFLVSKMEQIAGLCPRGEPMIDGASSAGAKLKTLAVVVASTILAVMRCDARA